MTVRVHKHGYSMANSRIERVLRHDGILAVLDWYTDPAHAGGQPQWAGDDNWRNVVMEAVKLRGIADQPSVRVLIGDHAVLVSGDDKHVVGVVFIKGHPVVKSVVRMVRQLLRPANPPPAAAPPAPVAPPIPAAPSPPSTPSTPIPTL